MRRPLLTIAGTLVAAAALIPGLAGALSPAPRVDSLAVASEGLTVAAKPGSGCTPLVEEPGDLCFDDGFETRPTVGRLPVRPGGRLRLVLGSTVRLIGIQLFHSNGSDRPPDLLWSGRADRASRSGRIWAVRLPRNLAGADVLYANTFYKRGDQSFSIAIRAEPRCPDAPTAVRAAKPAATPPHLLEQFARATFTSRGLSIAARFGSGCVPQTPRGRVCFDDSPYVPRPTAGRLPLGSRGRLLIRLGGGARRVSAQLLRFGGRTAAPRRVGPLLHGQQTDRAGRLWTMRLPHDVSRADVAQAYAIYPHGAAYFSARVRPAANC